MVPQSTWLRPTRTSHYHRVAAFSSEVRVIIVRNEFGFLDVLPNINLVKERGVARNEAKASLAVFAGLIGAFVHHGKGCVSPSASWVFQFQI